ncbi:amidohydrolase [Frigidibacter sp. MR17.24]|uniref:amidohydrolase n=1 Tax=Frigidibacter sp. MR17.24 TaxID=3127345 RepID=UPI003012D865
MTQATTILTNGKIWCGLAEGFAEALAIAGDKVLATGTAAEIAALAGPGTEVIDLGGRLATPGLNDAHMHLHNYGLNLLHLDLRARNGVTSVRRLLDMVAEAAKDAPKGAWILGRGYDHDKLEELRHPTLAELDAVAPDNPVYLVRTCGHTGVANGLAMQAGGITKDSEAPFGGRIGYTHNGELNGLLYENAREPVQKALPALTRADFVDAIERGGRKLVELGVTSVMEAAIGIQGYGMEELRAYQDALAQGRLPVRVAGTLMGDMDKNLLAEAHAEGLVTGAGCDMFRIGPVKFFTDGSAGAGTAWMTQEYHEQPGNYGVPCVTQEQCDALTLAAHRMGYQIAPHAIGDAAIEMVLNSYEKAYAEMPDPDRRHRIEHCGWHRPDQLERMKAMGVIPAGQPSFLYFFGDGYFMCLGEERPHHCYPFKTWLDSGLHPSASTDCPVTDPDPFACLYGLIARRSQGGRVLGEGECMSVAEALHCYTYEAAYGVHDETRKGRLVPGQLADVAVFDTDFFSVAPERILEAGCVMTLLGGKVVHGAAPVAEPA